MPIRLVASTRTARSFLALITLATPMLLFGPSARADIASDIAAAKARLAALQDQTEQISEAYNAAQIDLADAQRRASAARNAASTAQNKLAQQKLAVSTLARSMYMNAGQGTLTTFVAAGDPQAFLDQASTLSQVAASRAQVVDTLKAATKTARDAARAADTAERAAKKQADAVGGKRDQILAAVSQQSALIAQLQDEQARLVAQRQAELARAAEAQRAAAQAQLAQAQADQQSLASEAAATAASAPSTAPARKAAASEPPPPPSGDAVSTAIAWARREMGKPYVYGAAGPDTFDCSGLTMYVYGKAGISLPHYTGSQWNAGRHVSRDQLQPGDLVFFYSDLHHVGLYIGGGQMIDAPHSGAYVEQVPVWWDLYQGAVRVA